VRTPKRLKGKQSKAHVRSPRQERELAKRVGGRVTPGSGAGSEKADVRKPGVVRIEAKTTSHKSYSLTRKLAETLEEVAVTHDEIPFFEIEFLDEQGKPAQALCVMPRWALEQVVGAL